MRTASTDTKKKRLQCDECNRIFRTSQGLASHQRSVHPHDCPICEGGDGQACWSHFL